MFGGAFVGVVDLDRVMAAAVQAGELLVGHVLYKIEQFGVLAKEVLAKVGTTLGLVGLEVAIDALFHALEQEAGVVALEEGIPVRTPDNLDDVPAGAAEVAFELVDDALVAAHGTVEALQIAVDDEDEVVEVLARGQADGTEGVDFVSLAVADEGPDLAVSGLDELAILQILHEARLVDGVERTDAHADSGEAPEVGHEPRVGIARETGRVAEFVAEVVEVILGEAAFEVGTGVDAGGGVTLEIDEVTGLVAVFCSEEVVEADFKQGGE